MTTHDDQPDHPVWEEHVLAPVDYPADEDDLRVGLSRLAAMVAGARSVHELLRDVAEYGAAAIPGADGVGIAVARLSGNTMQVHAWEVSTSFAREVDTIQYEVLHQGPSVTCIRTGLTVISGSLGTDDRWPRFGTRVARLGVHSALSVPMSIADQVTGSINCYARAHDAFTEHAIHLGARFAGPAAVSIHNALLLSEARERSEQLERALVSRTVIDQAIGIIRSRTGGTAEESFHTLRTFSQSENVKLAIIAQRVVDEAVRRAPPPGKPWIPH